MSETEGLSHARQFVDKVPCGLVGAGTMGDTLDES